MEFDNVCTMIQGNLRSLQKSLGIKFCDIDRDHDDEVLQIAQVIRTVGKEASFDQGSIRKVHLMLLLNTNWEHIAYFEEDNNFCHLLNVVPPMSRYLYFKLVSSLGWHEYMGEVILHFPEFLVREMLTALEADLKYIDSKCAVPFVYSLLSNLFHKIMYLQEHCRHRVTEFVKLFTSISKFDFEAIVNEMDCPLEKKQQYWGYVYRMLLDLVRFCIEKIQNWDIPSFDVYSHTCEYDYAVWPQAKQGSCRGKLCLGHLASKCLTVSENISIDVYMSWTEVGIVGDVVEKTLQMSVRESAYKARQAITGVGDLHNSVAGLTALEKRLIEIELKPTTEEDEIAKSDADAILMNLFNPKKTQAKWLRGLINIGIFESAPHMKVNCKEQSAVHLGWQITLPPCCEKNGLQRQERIASAANYHYVGGGGCSPQVVSENARLMDVESMTLLVNSAVRYLSNHSIEEQEHELIRNTIKTCLRAQSQSDQLEVLSRFVKAYVLMAPLMSPTFDERTTLLFNKVVNDDESKDEIPSEMVWLAMENCEDIFKRAFNECLSSKHKTSLILDLVQFISPAADVIMPHSNLRLSFSHLLTIMRSVKNSSSEKLRGDFLHLMSLTCDMNICSAETLLFDHIIPSLERAVSEMKTDDVDFYLELVCALEHLCKPRKVQYIALLIRVLNRFRPKISNFNVHSVDIATNCIELLEHAMSEVEQNGPSNELTWLKSLAEKAPPLTTQYLGAVLHPSGKDKSEDGQQQASDKALFWSFRGLGHGTELKPHERAELVTSTLKILPSLTMKEWERIGGGRLADFEQITYTFAILVDSLLVLLQVPAMLQNLACFGNVVTNFVHFTKTNVLPKLKTKRGFAFVQDVKLKVQLLSSVLPAELVAAKRPQLQHLEQILDDIKKPKNAQISSDKTEKHVAFDEDATACT